MRLNRYELEEVELFLQGRRDLPAAEILEKVELGIWVFPPFAFSSLSLYGLDDSAGDGSPLFLAGRFGAAQSVRLMQQFRERQIPYLLVRVESYQAYLNCHGKIMSEHCDDDPDAIRAAIERLRQRCGGNHPSVAIADR